MNKHHGPGLWSGYSRIWRDYVSAHWKTMLAALVLMAIVAATSAAYAKFVQLLFEAFTSENRSFLTYAPWVIIALSVAKAISLYYQLVITNRVMTQVEVDMKKDMYTKLVYADIANLQSEPPAQTAARFSADVGSIVGAVQGVMASLSHALIVVATVFVMLTIDWAMTLAILLVFAISVVPIMQIGSRLNRISREIQGQIGKVAKEVNEGLSGIRLVRTYGLEPWVLDQAGGVFEQLRRSKMRMMNWKARMEPLMEIMGGVALALLLLLLAARTAQDGESSLAEFMALLTGFGVASASGRRLSGTYAEAQRGLAAVNRVSELLDREDRIVDAPDAVVVDKAKGNLAFEAVGFSYADGTVALADVSLDIKAGSKVAFVGRSGAGKSSLFNLIPRLFDPTEGRILLDGVDIREITRTSLRDQIAVVSQDSLLLTASVRENIAFGAQTADLEAVRAAAVAAEADGFISRLPKGYDTAIVPTNAEFSGGERQRLSIARAILRHAPILLLDEPTSALDAQAEASIKAALDRLSEGRTTLVIAHRLSTILDSDVIVAMDAGRIVEVGTHTDLIAKGGVYADLYRLQFGAHEALQASS